MYRHICLMIMFLYLMIGSHLSAQDAREIIARAEELIRANSSYSEFTMQVVKPDWSREMKMKVWSLEPEYALVLVTEPAKDKGTVTLKRDKEVWYWIPTVHRVVKIPPSMMLQSWMGSDFTNDDLVRQSSIVEDYKHSILAEEVYEGYDCYKIEMLPKPEAGVVWGKIITWIAKDAFFQLRADYYDEDDFMVKSMVGSKVEKMGGRTVPVHWEMIPHDQPGQKTVMEYLSIEFNIKTDESFFSLQNMKRVR